MDQRLLKELLEKAKSTKILDLQPSKLNSENTLDRENIVTVAATIPDIEGLVALDFSGCPLDLESMKILNSAIKQCKSLLYLGMHSVQLDDKSALDLINVVTDHPSLLALDISFNKLVRLSGQSISKLLNHNPRLLSLNISGNSLGMEDAEVLRAVKNNRTILSFNVSPTDMSDDTIDEINEKTEENRQYFEDEIIKENKINFISFIPLNLVKFLDSLIPNFVPRPVKLDQSPVVFIGEWQALQQDKLLAVENSSLNILHAYSTKKEQLSDLPSKENTPQKILKKTSASSFIN